MSDSPSTITFPMSLDADEQSFKNLWLEVATGHGTRLMQLHDGREALPILFTGTFSMPRTVPGL